MTTILLNTFTDRLSDIAHSSLRSICSKHKRKPRSYLRGFLLFRYPSPKSITTDFHQIPCSEYIILLSSRLYCRSRNHTGSCLMAHGLKVSLTPSVENCTHPRRSIIICSCLLKTTILYSICQRNATVFYDVFYR